MHFPRSKYLFLCILAFFFHSCYKEVAIDIPAHTPKIVVNSLFQEGKPIAVNVNTSKYIYDTLSIYNGPANVVLGYEDTLISLTDQGKGIFSSNHIHAQSGMRYRLTVSIDGYETVNAEDSLSFEVPFQLVRFIPDAKIDEEGDSYSLFEISFNDPGSENNYYEISLVSIGTYGKVRAYLVSNDPYVLNEGDTEFFPQNILLSDKMFNGELVHLTFYSMYYKEADKKYFLFFRCISHNYYKYKKKLLRHMENQVYDIWDGTGNPVLLYTNIKNGFGIFAGYAVDSCIIDLP